MSKRALLIIDMLNTLEFPEWRSLLKHAVPAARSIAALKKRFRGPVIYVNDNFGEWHSDQRKLFEACLAGRGGELARLLAPGERDYFVLKPRNSGFFESTLDTLLKELHVRRVVLTGVAGNNCVLFTAHDAHMRGYEVEIPRACVASNTVRDNNEALRLLKVTVKPRLT